MLSFNVNRIGIITVTGETREAWAFEKVYQYLSSHTATLHYD
jgi:hypothetical protein